MAEPQDNLPAPTVGEIVLYSTPGGDIRVECLLCKETIWLTQKAIAELFGVEVPAISKHLANIYDSEELEPEATLSKMETVRHEGGRQVKRKLDYYNLDAKVSALEARLKAEGEYETFRVRQDREFVSDFDQRGQAAER